MADVPSTGPDNYVELIDQQTPSHYEQKVGPEYGKLSFEIGGVVFDIKKNLITILDSPEVKEDSKRKREELKSEISGELVGEEKEQFILKLNKSGNQSIKKSIETGTIKTFETPSNEVLAISVGSNLDYLYYKDGTLLFSFKGKRDGLYSAFLGFSHGDFTEVDKGNGIYKIIVNEKELEPFSNESINEYYKWGKFMEKHIKKLQNVYENWDDL